MITFQRRKTTWLTRIYQIRFEEFDVMKAKEEPTAIKENL